MSISKKQSSRLKQERLKKISSFIREYSLDLIISFILAIFFMFFTSFTTLG